MGVFEYTNSGTIDARRAAQFAEKIKDVGRVADDLGERFFEDQILVAGYVVGVGGVRAISKPGTAERGLAGGHHRKHRLLRCRVLLRWSGLSTTLGSPRHVATTFFAMSACPNPDSPDK
jgi:hypothetical protein